MKPEIDTASQTAFGHSTPFHLAARTSTRNRAVRRCRRLSTYLERRSPPEGHAFFRLCCDLHAAAEGWYHFHAAAEPGSTAEVRKSKRYVGIPTEDSPEKGIPNENGSASNSVCMFLYTLVFDKFLDCSFGHMVQSPHDQSKRY